MAASRLLGSLWAQLREVGLSPLPHWPPPGTQAPEQASLAKAPVPTHGSKHPLVYLAPIYETPVVCQELEIKR